MHLYNHIEQWFELPDFPIVRSYLHYWTGLCNSSLYISLWERYERFYYRYPYNFSRSIEKPKKLRSNQKSMMNYYINQSCVLRNEWSKNAWRIQKTSDSVYLFRDRSQWKKSILKTFSIWHTAKPLERVLIFLIY